MHVEPQRRQLVEAAPRHSSFLTKVQQRCTFVRVLLSVGLCSFVTMALVVQLLAASAARPDSFLHACDKGGTRSVSGGSYRSPSRGQMLYQNSNMLAGNMSAFNQSVQGYRSDDIPGFWSVNEYFDRVFVINLERRVEKWYRTKARLASFGIHAERVPGCDPQAAKYQDTYEEWLKRPETPIEKESGARIYPSAGVWAHQFSVGRAVELARKRGYKRFLLLDDNVFLHKDFEQLFNERARQVSPLWKILYLGAIQHTWTEPSYVFYDKDVRDYYHPAKTDGSFAVAFDESVYSEVLEQIARFKGPVGRVVLRHVVRKYPKSSLVLSPNLVIANLEDSDYNAPPNSFNELAKRIKWNLDEYDRAEVPADMLEPPKVSVICTFKNAEDTIEMSLRSVLDQTYWNLELIVVDDLSDDGSVPIVEKLRMNDERIVLIKNEINLGTYQSRNVALMAASGSVITFQDADDISKPDRLEKQIEKIAYGQVLLSVGLIVRSHVSAQEFKRHFKEDGIDFEAMDREVQERRTHYANPEHFKYCCQAILGLMTTMYDRRVFDEIGPFDAATRFGGDAEFAERLLAHYSGIMMTSSESVHSYLWWTNPVPHIFHRVDEVILWSVEKVSSLSKAIPIGGEARERYREQYQRKLRLNIARKPG